MSEAGQAIESPGGMKLRFIRTAAETDGELLEMEAAYSGDGRMPPMHLHPSQSEHFEILEGERLHGDGPDSAGEMGDSFLAEFADEFQLTGSWDPD